MELLLSHLIGDFLLQNHWMQGKTERWLPCLAHVACYIIPFFFLTALSPLALGLIALQHAVQDRYRLNVTWSRLVKQTSPETWPQGMLWVDQSLHAVWIGLVVILTGYGG